MFYAPKSGLRSIVSSPGASVSTARAMPSVLRGSFVCQFENDLIACATQSFSRTPAVAAPIFASVEENRRFGEACAEAIAASNRKVAVLASGSLSHKLVANDQVGDTCNIALDRVYEGRSQAGDTKRHVRMVCS